jgi:hypothetical protein
MKPPPLPKDVDSLGIGGGIVLAARLKRLIADAERPAKMSFLLDQAITFLASVIADDGIDIDLLNRMKTDPEYVTCAKHILLQEEQDNAEAEADDEEEP